MKKYIYLFFTTVLFFLASDNILILKKIPLRLTDILLPNSHCIILKILCHFIVITLIKAAATPLEGNKTQKYGIAYYNKCLC